MDGGDKGREREGDAVKVDVRFADRRDVLNAYWGYLSGGGLIINDDNLLEGERVDLHVFVEANHSDYELAGKVVRRQPDRAVIAFDPGESHNRMLTAALCDATVELDARITDDHTRTEAQTLVFSLSEQGCCLRLAADTVESFSVGSAVTIESKEFCIEGCIVWAGDADRCVVFGREDDDAGLAALRTYVQSLQS